MLKKTQKLELWFFCLISNTLISSIWIDVGGRYFSKHNVQFLDSQILIILCFSFFWGMASCIKSTKGRQGHFFVSNLFKRPWKKIRMWVYFVQNCIIIMMIRDFFFSCHKKYFIFYFCNTTYMVVGLPYYFFWQI